MRKATDPALFGIDTILLITLLPSFSVDALPIPSTLWPSLTKKVNAVHVKARPEARQVGAIVSAQVLT